MYWEKLEAILKEYNTKFDYLNEQGKNKPDAGRKWRILDAAAGFDPAAEDLAGQLKMLSEAVNGLIDSSRLQPTEGLLLLHAQEDEADFVRESLRNLLGKDDGDLADRQNRIEHFVEDVNRHLALHLPKIDIYRQNFSSALGYLAVLRPAENYFYKSTVADNWAMSIEFSEDFGRAKTFSLRRYYNMCDELREALERYPFVLEKHAQRRRDMEIVTEDDLHMLVYEIMQCTDSYHLDAKRVKMTVKERLSRAVIREERNSIIEKLLEIENRIETLGERQSLPDLTGQTVHHKTFGQGEVRNCSDGRIEVAFRDTVKKFQYPDAFAAGFLSSDTEENMQAFREEAFTVTELKNLNRERERLQDSLKHIG